MNKFVPLPITTCLNKHHLSPKPRLDSTYMPSYQPICSLLIAEPTEKS